MNEYIQYKIVRISKEFEKLGNSRNLLRMLENAQAHYPDESDIWNKYQVGIDNNKAELHKLEQGFDIFLSTTIYEIYNKGVEDTVKKIAKWVDDNTGSSGDVSYPDLMEFMADI